MPFDQMRGVGYLIGRTALVISADEPVIVEDQGTQRVTLTIPQAATINFIQVVVNFGSGGECSIPQFEVERNGVTIDELQYTEDVGTIRTNTGSSVLYFYKQETADQVYGGDTYAIRLHHDGGPCADTVYNVSFIIIGQNN